MEQTEECLNQMLEPIVEIIEYEQVIDFQQNIDFEENIEFEQRLEVIVVKTNTFIIRKCWILNLLHLITRSFI